MAANCCEKEIDSTKKEFIELAQEVKQLKQVYHKLLVENLQKDIITEQSKSKIQENKFASFSEYFSKNCIEKLNTVGRSQKEDSHFVSLALHDLYKKNPEAIKQKSLSGRSKKNSFGTAFF